MMAFIPIVFIAARFINFFFGENDRDKNDASYAEVCDQYIIDAVKNIWSVKGALNKEKKKTISQKISLLHLKVRIIL